MTSTTKPTSIDADTGAPRPGTLLTSRRGEGGHPLPDAAENHFVTYTSMSFDGGVAVVSGQVALPHTSMPAGGYPVVCWAPGTSGMGAHCAPSNFPGHLQTLNEWVRRGYAVLRTDYEGWGEGARRPLLNQLSNSHAVVNLVGAARALSDKLSRSWLVMGHSEGGGAALWTASRGSHAASGCDLKGAIALAPVGPGVLKLIGDLADGTDTRIAFPLLAPEVAAYLAAATVLGAQVSDPLIVLDDLVAPAFRPFVEASRTSCVVDPLPSLPLPPRGHYLRRGSSYARLDGFLRGQDASSLKLSLPVMVAQAGSDNLTPTPETTSEMVRALDSRGAAIVFSSYAGKNHSEVVAASLEDALAFADDVFAGRRR
jgi:pimeloyl-ACP methyl ester carboxylesterase